MLGHRKRTLPIPHVCSAKGEKMEFKTEQNRHNEDIFSSNHVFLDLNHPYAINKIVCIMLPYMVGDFFHWFISLNDAQKFGIVIPVAYVALRLLSIIGYKKLGY